MRTRKTAQRAEADDQPEPRAQAMRVEAATDTLLPRERESRAATVTANLGVEPENESEPLPAEAAEEEMDNDPEDDADSESGTSMKGKGLITREQSYELQERTLTSSEYEQWATLRREMEQEFGPGGTRPAPLLTPASFETALSLRFKKWLREEAQQKAPGETLRARAGGPETSGTLALQTRETTTTGGMLVQQGAKGGVTQDDADAKRPGRAPGTESGFSMTADGHIPRRRYAVRDLGAEKAYEGEEHLGREQKPRREIAERKAAGQPTRRDAQKEEPPTRTDIPSFIMTWEKREQLSKYGMNPNGTYSFALGRPTDPGKWETKRAALMRGRMFFEQNMPLWTYEWARDHELNVQEAALYAQRHVPKLPPIPEAFHESPP
jgi:hypothetical protein